MLGAMIPAIGSMAALHSGGRFGLVIDARAVGPEQDGQQLVSVRLKAVDGRDARGFTAPASVLPAPTEPEPRAAKLPLELNAAEKQEVARLEQRDAQVRQEENAHAGNAGDLAGPISYVYQTVLTGGAMPSAGRSPFRLHPLPAIPKSCGASVPASMPPQTRPSTRRARIWPPPARD